MVTQQQQYQQAPYTPNVQDQWHHGQGGDQSLLQGIIDTTDLERKFDTIRAFVEYGMVDVLIELSESDENTARLQQMKTDYQILQAELEMLYQQNHEIALRAGAYQHNGANGDQAQATAVNTHWGTNHQQTASGQWGVQHGPTQYHQQGMPNQTHPSIGNLLWGSAARLAGVPMPQQQAPPPYYQGQQSQYGGY